MQPQLIKVAITGNVGCGKTLVCNIVKSFGYEVFNADEAVSLILQEKSVLSLVQRNLNLSKEFTNKSFKDQKLEIANAVFLQNDAAKLLELEKIIYPQLQTLKDKFIDEVLQKCLAANDAKEKSACAAANCAPEGAVGRGSVLCFLEIPLLFEKNTHAQIAKDYNFIVTVSASDDVRIQNFLKRSGIKGDNLSEVEKRTLLYKSIDARQMPLSYKEKHSHFVISNNSSTTDLQLEVRRMLDYLELEAKNV